MKTTHIKMSTENGRPVIRQITDDNAAEQLFQNLKGYNVTNDGVAIKKDEKAKSLDIIYDESSEKIASNIIMRFLR